MTAVEYFGEEKMIEIINTLAERAPEFFMVIAEEAGIDASTDDGCEEIAAIICMSNPRDIEGVLRNLKKREGKPM